MKPYTAADFQFAMQGPDPRMEELAYLQARLGSPVEFLQQSQPLVGLVLTEQGPMEVADAIVAFDVGSVVYRFGAWVVTEDGIACLAHHYPLTRARLQEHQDWGSHLAMHAWVNLWDLVRALAVARRLWAGREDSGPYGDGAHPS
jgi:hypothetical protein